VNTLLLVRHGKAGRREDWNDDDRLRPLSGKGRLQADALVGIVAKLIPKHAGPVPVFSSPWTRCLQTVEPMSVHFGVAVEPEAALGEGMGPRAAELVLEMGARSAVCCTHGDVIGAILSCMQVEGLDLGRRPVWPKGSIWVLQTRHGVFRAARYVAPPS
jgi:broad specificity phosphatase PhoE